MSNLARKFLRIESGQEKDRYRRAVAQGWLDTKVDEVNVSFRSSGMFFPLFVEIGSKVTNNRFTCCYHRLILMKSLCLVKAQDSLEIIIRLTLIFSLSFPGLLMPQDY